MRCWHRHHQHFCSRVRLSEIALTLTSVIRDLPDAWEAETCDRFVEQYFDAEPKLKDVKQMIEDMAMQMRQISENFEKADQDMKSQM